MKGGRAGRQGDGERDLEVLRESRLELAHVKAGVPIPAMRGGLGDSIDLTLRNPRSGNGIMGTLSP